MSHSKRNTSLAFFTSHERSLLKSHWGSQSTRLTRDSFLPFASCVLCLQLARTPVACSACGTMFCRECIVSNLLAQGREIKRMKKEEGRREKESAEEDSRRRVEEGERVVGEFERVTGGLEASKPQKAGGLTMTGEGEMVGMSTEAGRGVKRKFELDEASMLRAAQAERAKARKSIDAEAAAKPVLPSFWVPSLTPSTTPQTQTQTQIQATMTPPPPPTNGNAPSNSLPPKHLHPLCPASTLRTTHPLSLKSLITIHFSPSSSTDTTAPLPPHPTTTPSPPTADSSSAPPPTCPACTKTLSNSLKALLAVPCGHVLCKPCAGKFMMAPQNTTLDPHASPPEKQVTEKGRGKESCFVCEAELGGRGMGKAGGGGGVGGLVELRSEGTGFAGGGNNMAKMGGVAFQC